jgi:hypothetical protein
VGYHRGIRSWDKVLELIPAPHKNQLPNKEPPIPFANVFDVKTGGELRKATELPAISWGDLTLTLTLTPNPTPLTRPP